MIKEEVGINVVERNDPLVLLQVWINEEGVRTPYDFTGVTDIEFIIKEKVADPDADALVTYKETEDEITVLGLPTDGRVSVQILNTVLTSGNKRYRLDVIRTDKRETVMAGPLLVRNV